MPAKKKKVRERLFTKKTVENKVNDVADTAVIGSELNCPGSVPSSRTEGIDSSMLPPVNVQPLRASSHLFDASIPSATSQTKKTTIKGMSEFELPSMAASECSETSDCDIFVGPPSKGPRIEWSELGLAASQLNPLPSSSSPTTPKQSRGRAPKRKIHSDDKLLEATLGVARNVRGRFVSKTSSILSGQSENSDQSTIVPGRAPTPVTPKKTARPPAAIQSHLRSAGSSVSATDAEPKGGRRVSAAKRNLDYDILELQSSSASGVESAAQRADKTLDTRICNDETGSVTMEDDTDNPTHDALPEEADDPVFTALLAQLSEAMKVVTANGDTAAGTVQPNCTTIVADVPQYLSLEKIQTEIESSVTYAGLDFCRLNAHTGQSRLNGFVQDINECLGDFESYEPIVKMSTFCDTVRTRTVFIVENANRISENDWCRFLEVISYIKYGESNVELAGKVVFVLIGDDKISIHRKEAVVSDPKTLPGAARCYSSISNDAQPTQHIRSYMNRLLAEAAASPETADSLLDHRDRVMAIVSPSEYRIENFTPELVTAAECQFPGDAEVLKLTCYETSSSRLPGALSFYDFMKYSNIRSWPDEKAKKKHNIISQDKIRLLSKTKVVFIDGYEMLTEVEGSKLSRALNQSKKISNDSRCNICGNKLMFGGVVVVLIYGDRNVCQEDPFCTSQESVRMAIYKFTDEPENWTIPSYIAPATTSEAFDKCKELEMSMLKDANRQRMEYCLGEFYNSLQDLPQPLRYDNVMVVDAPAFVPLQDLVEGFMEVASERQLSVLQLSCYPQNSLRLPDATNIYDYLMEYFGVLRADPKGQPFPLLDENDEHFLSLQGLSLIIIDGVENLPRIVADIIDMNINKARGLEDLPDVAFAGIQVLMLSGLQDPPAGLFEGYVESVKSATATRSDFTRMPTTPTRTFAHMPRGQSPSLDRSHGRCVPPVRGAEPGERAAPRGGQQQRRTPPPRSRSSSPLSYAGGRSSVPSRPRRKCRGPDITTLLLDRLEDTDEEEPARSSETNNDPDYFPNNQRRNASRGRPRELLVIPSYIHSTHIKEKYRKAAKSGTLRAAKGQINSHSVRYKHFGFLGQEKCTECKALFFKGEGIKSATQPGFLQCCQHGKVFFDPPVIPDEITNLLDKKHGNRKHFLRHIRTYNSYFAMASFQGRFARMEHNFPYVVKLHGQIQVLMHHALPKNYVPGSANAQKIMPSQLFFVDAKDAQLSRDAFQPNNLLEKDILDRLHRLMEKANALYRSFERMATLLKKAKREWSENNNGAQPPNIKLVFKRRVNDTSRILFRPTGSTYEDPRFEAPMADGENEVAAIFDSNYRPVNVPLWVCQEGRPVKLDARNPLREPLLYPLMYADGLPKWYSDTPHAKNQTRVQNRVTIRQYYSFILHLRREKYLQRMLGALTQQWIVEGWVRVEDSDLDYIRNLDYMRVSTRPNLTKFLTTLAEREGMDLGKELKLPSSFSHSPAQMQRYYMNSIQMVRELGLPDLFVTITMDKNSPELKDDENIDNSDPSLNTAEVCRLFWRKVDYFIRMVRDEMIFGPCVGIVLVVEFQKRGLPHVHAILTLNEKIRTPEDVDQFVTTAIPDQREDPELFELVTSKMVHQECGPRCMKKNKCAKGYPMAWRDETTLDDGRGFVAMARPFEPHPDRPGEPAQTFMLNKKIYDRRSVVPYNAYLLRRLGCHINIVPVNSFRQISYLFKYVFKGGDLAQLELNWKPSSYKIKNPYRPSTGDLLVASTSVSRPRRTDLTCTRAPVADEHSPRPPAPDPPPSASTDPGPNHSAGQSRVQELDPSANEEPRPVLNYDETSLYQTCRYVSSMEATWRILGLPLFYFSHKVNTLAVHLEGENPVVFKKGEAAAAAQKELRPSTLTEYFALVENSRSLPSNDPERIHLQSMLYSDLPKKYIWDAQGRKWKRRKKSIKPNLGRLAAASPNSGDRFYLRLLLQEVPGCASFAELRTHEGKLFGSFKDACVSRGLAKDDEEYKRCLAEDALHSTPYRLRLLYVLLLSHCNVIDPAALFELHWRQMAEHWLKRYDEERARQICKAWIRQRVRANYGNVNDPLFDGVPENQYVPPECDEDEPAARVSKAAAKERLDALNADQRRAADAVLSAVKAWCRRRDRIPGDFIIPSESSVFLVEGPAGTGKTTTYNAICTSLASEGESVLCMAFTGSAACLLPNGRTCHNALKLPVPLNEESVSALEPGYEQWKMIEKASLIIVDEVAMAPAVIFEILDKLLRRMYEAEYTFHPMFAGKVVLFGGDMRQLGPIPSDGQTMGQLHFRNSLAFAEAKKFRLEINMRTLSDEKDFADFLRSLGEGTSRQYIGLPKHSVRFDQDMIISDRKLETLIEWTFGQEPWNSGANRAILTPLNRDCFKINKLIVDAMPGTVHRALSEDSIIDDCSANKLLAEGSREEATAEVAPSTSRRLIHQDELHMILETGMPPHVLELKKGAILNLIKNLDVKAGLVNGCRLRTISVSRDRLEVEIISNFPNLREKTVSLPRVRFLKEVSHALVMQRVQFPVRVAFACTVNKSQGLTLERVGIYLPQPMSDHGKLYVAMSRVRRRQDLKVLVMDDTAMQLQGKDQKTGAWFTRNIVIKQLIDFDQTQIPVIPRTQRQPPPLAHLESSTELSQNLQQLSEKAKCTTEFIHRLKGLTDKVTENSSTFESAVEVQCMELVAAIEARKAQLLDFVRQEREMRLRALREQMTLCTARLQQTTALLQFCIEALKETDSVSFLQIGSMLIARAANADLTWHKDISSAPRVSPEFDLTLDDKAVLRAVEQLNFIQMKPPAAPAIIPEECSAENNSVTVAWQPPPTSYVEGYVLELDDGCGGDFREVYCGKETICTVDGLHFHSLYNARVRAFNSTGEGPYSECIGLQTAEVAWFTYEPNTAPPELRFTEDNCTVTGDGYEHRVVLGTVGFSRGVHYWEYTIDRYDADADPSFGVARLDVTREQMLGKDDKGWSMYIDRQRSWFMHGSIHDQRCEGGISVGCTIGVLLDLERRQLSFYVNDEPQGPIAFKDLFGVFYPAISINRGVTVTLHTALDPPTSDEES